MPKDWFEWHDLYNTEPRMQQRLQLVRESLSKSLDACPAGIIRVVSVCAGDGRDLLGTLSNHPRSKDVYARLIELNPKLVERGRAAIESAGLGKQIEFINGDATISSNYIGVVPADIVIVCGVFGHLADEAELRSLLRNLSFLCKKGSFIIWTRRYRGRANGISYFENVRKVLREAAFEEVSFKLTLTKDVGVGTHRYLSEGSALPKDQQLFVFFDLPTE
ncbi:class I SAM-dependent methyltransferase family protein [Fischerella sp. PCC 9605]|uniref:class I SAM-dependent methyltransferase family protein n=1 Tax=Fischerella sp. PCC 9605 TaxID=1173024 RepID=UPI00047A953D|nr:class I SAM-dependent methyltransferase family protein [Fischerella sp. PCC 9605]